MLLAACPSKMLKTGGIINPRKPTERKRIIWSKELTNDMDSNHWLTLKSSSGFFSWIAKTTNKQTKQNAWKTRNAIEPRGDATSLQRPHERMSEAWGWVGWPTSPNQLDE